MKTILIKIELFAFGIAQKISRKIEDIVIWKWQWRAQELRRKIGRPIGS
jgi:hypothetical protein